MRNGPNHAAELSTKLVHAGERQPPPAGRPTATPLYTSTTYLHPSLAALDTAFAEGVEPVYSRYGNPTVSQLEAAVAVAEGGLGATAFGSGMAALHAALLAACTPRGETKPALRGVVASRDLYGATTRLLQDFFSTADAPLQLVDVCDLAAVEEAVKHRPGAVVVVEQLSNPLLRVCDVKALAAITHAVGGRLIVDNTMASPIVEQPIALGADLVVHSATKFLGGHADVTGGAVVARTGMLLESLKRYSKLVGSILGPFEAFLIGRGIKTLDLRLRAQCQSALTVAEWLATHPAVDHVYYPGLSSHPQHELARDRFNGLYGALVSFELKGPAETSRDRVFRFVDALQLVLPATSLGDVYTIVTAPMVSSHRDLTTEERAERGIRDSLVRLSVGIESVRDVQRDIEQALEKL